MIIIDNAKDRYWELFDKFDNICPTCGKDYIMMEAVCSFCGEETYLNDPEYNEYLELLEAMTCE